jgi:hypothetical protein
MDTALLIVISLACLVPIIGFLGILQNALKKCAPVSRTMKPGKVWLVLIPLFGLIWQFNVVLNVSDSLENEFARVGIPCPTLKGTMAVGVAMCICNSCVLIPVRLLRDLILIVGFVLWIVYWGRIADLSRTLDAPAAVAPSSQVSH